MLRDREGVSLWEHWKLHYQRKGYRSEANLARSRRLAAVFFVGSAVSWVYCMVRYAVPFYFKDYDVQAVYWLKVAASFAFVNTVANWLCAIFYSSVLKETRDRPRTGNRTLWDAAEGEGSHRPPPPPRDGHAAADPAADYCAACCLERPPLTHHCRDCNKCVLRRDHHCYLLGKWRSFVAVSPSTSSARASRPGFVAARTRTSGRCSATFGPSTFCFPPSYCSA